MNFINQHVLCQLLMNQENFYYLHYCRTTLRRNALFIHNLRGLILRLALSALEPKNGRSGTRCHPFCSSQRANKQIGESKSI